MAENPIAQSEEEEYLSGYDRIERSLKARGFSDPTSYQMVRWLAGAHKALVRALVRVTVVTAHDADDMQEALDDIAYYITEMRNCVEGDALDEWREGDPLPVYVLSRHVKEARAQWEVQYRVDQIRHKEREARRAAEAAASPHTDGQGRGTDSAVR